MLEAAKKSNQVVVDLGKGIFARTELSEPSIPALRSGFAGYPANPRWSALKFRAWKIGRQWRQALENGELKVRDAMLVPANLKPASTPALEVPMLAPVAVALKPC